MPEIPDWLTQPQTPSSAKKVFKSGDRTVLGLLSVLSRIRLSAVYSESYLRRLHPGLKLLVILETILLVSLSSSFFFILAVGALILLLIGTLEAEDILPVLAVTSAALLFSFLMLLPSYLTGNSANVLKILIKIGISAALMNVFARTARWREMVRSLKWLRVPDIFILTLDITQKYIYVLGDFALQMLTALKLRSAGGNGRERHPVIRIIGVLFLKSREMAESLYASMECRCFDGSYPILFNTVKGYPHVRALTNLFAGMAPDYRAGSGAVELVKPEVSGDFDTFDMARIEAHAQPLHVDQARAALTKVEALSSDTAIVDELRSQIEAAATTSLPAEEEVEIASDSAEVEDVPTYEISDSSSSPNETIGGLVADLESSLGSGFLPEMNPVEGEPEPVMHASETSGHEHGESTELGSMVSDLEAALGDTSGDDDFKAFLLRGKAVPGVNTYLPRPLYVEGKHMPFAGAGTRE